MLCSSCPWWSGYLGSKEMINLVSVPTFCLQPNAVLFDVNFQPWLKLLLLAWLLRTSGALVILGQRKKADNGRSYTTLKTIHINPNGRDSDEAKRGDGEENEDRIDRIDIGNVLFTILIMSLSVMICSLRIPFPSMFVNRPMVHR